MRLTETLQISAKLQASVVFRGAAPQLDRCHKSAFAFGSFFRESLHSAWRVSLLISCCITVLAKTLVLAGACPEATEDSSAAPAWRRGAHSQDHGSAQQTQSGLVLLGLSVSTCRGCGSESLNLRDAFPLATRRRRDGAAVAHQGEGRGRARGVCWPRSRLWYRPKLLTKKHEATRLSPEDADAEAAANVIAALDRWAVEASKQSAETLHKAQRESHEAFDHLLKNVEDIDKQVLSITIREDSLVLGADGWFRDYRQAVKRVIAGIAE